ncbi:MAG TPA: hypothetical protein VEJ63_07735 [Planctomycetota bacterium]|nr:hypothetical protein [Planctomycetota bacterium]
MRVVVVTLVAALACVAFSAEKPAAVKPLPKAEIEKLVQDLGSDDFNKRQEAEKKLADQGETARAALEAALKSSKDAELQARAKSILKKIDMPRDLAKLSAERRQLATMSIEDADGGGAAGGMRVVAGAGAGVGAAVAVGGGGGGDDSGQSDTLTVSLKPHGNHLIVEMGNTRLVLENQTYNGTAQFSMPLKGGGMSSCSAGSFSGSYSNNEAKFSFRKIAWSIHNAETLKVAAVETKLGTPETRRVLFLDANGSVLHNVEAPIEKKKDAPAKDAKK